jgi:hypothetical protein
VSLYLHEEVSHDETQNDDDGISGTKLVTIRSGVAADGSRRGRLGGTLGAGAGGVGNGAVLNLN